MTKTLHNSKPQNDDFKHIAVILAGILTIKFIGAYASVFVILGYISWITLNYTNVDKIINNNIVTIENMIDPITSSENWVYFRPVLYTIFVSLILFIAI